MSNSRFIGTFRYSQFAFRDPDDYPMGTDSTPDVVTNGTATHAYLNDKGISVGGIGLTYDIIQAAGGGRIWCRKVQGISDVANLPLELSDYDPVLEGYWNDTAPDTTTVSGVSISASNLENPNPPEFICVFTSEEACSPTENVYFNRIVSGQVISTNGKTQSTAGGTNPNPLAYEIVPKSSNRLPWGQLYSANANIATYANSDYEIIIETKYPLAVTTYIGDGVATADAFSLGYAPATTDTSSQWFVFKEGVDDLANISGVSVGGSVSVTAAIPSGERLVVLYPTLFEPAS